MAVQYAHKANNNCNRTGLSSVDPDVIAVTSLDTFTPLHITRELLDHGYNVRGTVQPNSHVARGRPFGNLVEKWQTSLRPYNMNLLDGEEAWDNFLQGVSVVIHVVNPLPMDHRPKNGQMPRVDEQIVKDTLKACQNMLAACGRAKSTRRIILVTSVATIAWKNEKGNNHVPYTEEDFEDETSVDGFGKCHILAERAAWDFVNSLTESDKIDLVVMNPAFIIGPMAWGVWTYTDEVILQLLGAERSTLPPINIPYVDVRDVASAVCKAISWKAVEGKRHILCGSCNWVDTVASILSKEFCKEGYNFGPAQTEPWCTSCLCRKRTELDLGDLYETMKCAEFRYDTRRMREVLDISPVSIEETIIETAYSLIHWNFTNIRKRRVSA